MRLVTGAASDVGRRRSENEDFLLVDDDRHLYAVADGMGGHNAGEVASATAVEALRATFTNVANVADAIQQANEAVVDKSATDAGLEGMGTTLTVVVVDDSVATIGHVGDSRAYLVRDGELTQITEDHSWVEQLVREGRLTPEQAHVHPQRSIVTRALGIEPVIEVDVDAVDLRPDDRLLLCSDGLTSMVREPEIAAILRREPDPQRTADALVAAANRAGGDDNITVIVIDVKGDLEAEALEASRALTGAPIPHAPTGRWEVDDSAAVGQGSAAVTAGLDDGTPQRPEEEHAGDGRGTPEGGAGDRRRRRTTRLLAVLLPVVIVIGVATGALAWYARRTYFVGLRQGRVAIYRGVPGGLLGWQPTVDRRFFLTADELGGAERADLTSGHRFSSKGAAVRFVHRLEAHAATATTPPPTGRPTSPGAPTTTPGPPVNTVKT